MKQLATWFVCLPGVALVFASNGCSRMPSAVTPSLRGSVGLPHYGFLTDAVELPLSGPGYRCFDPSGHHFGTRPLIDAITYGAEQVKRERPDSQPLLVGDLSAKTGGSLHHHASHRTGRDVDLLFYTTTLAGEPIESPGWVKFGPDGLGLARVADGYRYVRLDIERNWLLTKALLNAPAAPPVWLFVAKPIEALITEYALARGEDPELVWHAENVMQQPTNSLPHDDHVHLRIACTADMVVAGCEDSGPRWPWLAPVPSLSWPDNDDDIAKFVDVDSMAPLASTAADASAR